MMIKIQFARKPVNLQELKMLTVLERDKVDCIVEKIIELEPYEYEDFSNNLLSDYKFIEETMNFQCVDTQKRWHCILVKARDVTDGILVESEGYHYARYAAYLENIEDLVSEPKSNLTK